MERLLPFFIAVTALAVVLQMAILAAMYLQMRQMNERITRIASDLQGRINPILTRLQVLVEDTQPRITSVVVDAAEIVHLARSQAQKMDRVFTEAIDRMRIQLIHVDQILTGTLEALEDAGSRIRRTVWGPVQQASAFVKGVKTGLDFFRSQRRPQEGKSETQDEGLFI